MKVKRISFPNREIHITELPQAKRISRGFGGFSSAYLRFATGERQRGKGCGGARVATRRTAHSCLNVLTLSDIGGTGDGALENNKLRSSVGLIHAEAAL